MIRMRLPDGAQSTLLAQAGIAGVAVWQLQSSYSSFAPHISELRESGRDDIAVMQRLLDADMMTGGLTVIASVAACLMLRTWLPAVLLVGAFAWVSYYHHSVLKGPTTQEILS